jgi:glyoxylate/hydroxypyruvate reductase
LLEGERISKQDRHRATDLGRVNPEEFEERGVLTIKARKRAIEDTRAGLSRHLRIHLLHAADIEAYWFDPEGLREAVRRGTGGRVAVTATVSSDPGVVTPEMRHAQVLAGFNLPTARMAEMPELRWIHLVSAGVDHLLPLDWLPARVTLTNSSGVHSKLAGEYAAAAVLMLNFRLPVHATNQRHGHWQQVFNSPLAGKTVVLVGLGAIGGSAARQLKRLGLRVLGIRPSGRAHPHADRVHPPAALPKLLPRADFLVVTAPLTDSSRNLIGAKELDALKPGAGLVNMSRAALVDYEAMARRLEAGQLAGAVIDVCDPEPLPPASPLWHTRNLLITPHVSSDPTDYVTRMTRIFVDNARRLMTGRPLRNRVQPRRGY